jgi:hypothetical protein
LNTKLDKLAEKLERVAAAVAKEKPTLHFFGLVARPSGPPDHWDLLVSSDQLVPWSLDAIHYLVNRLKKALTLSEFVRIARVVALPKDSEFIADLRAGENGHRFRRVRPSEVPEQAVIIWPQRPARVVTKG